MSAQQQAPDANCKHTSRLNNMTTTEQFFKKIRTYTDLTKEAENAWQKMLMVEGKYLDHPELEEGNRTRMKILRVDPNKDLSIKTIESILQKALDLYKTGIIKLNN